MPGRHVPLWTAVAVVSVVSTAAPASAADLATGYESYSDTGYSVRSVDREVRWGTQSYYHRRAARPPVVVEHRTIVRPPTIVERRTIIEQPVIERRVVVEEPVVLPHAPFVERPPLVVRAAPVPYGATAVEVDEPY